MASKSAPVYRLIRWLVKACYPRITAEGTEKLPDEPVIIVGNHAQLHGPVACELYTPGSHYTWCAGQMMCLKEVPDYAYTDFWSGKPRSTRWFYKLLSYLIAPLSVCIFRNANTIAVYHDARILSTFKTTVARLREGSNVVIFPEKDAPHNNIVCQFQDRFVDVARLYYKQTGQALAFVPVYVAPKLGKMYYGTPVRFCPDAPIAQERRRICDCMASQITDIAQSLPEHTVIPYRNIPKKHYPTNVPKEAAHESACDRLP